MKKIVLISTIVIFFLQAGNNVIANLDCCNENKSVFASLLYYYDNDLDGYGDPNKSTTSPTPFVHVKDNTDCNDSDKSINPGAIEIAADGVDSNCDGFDNPVWYLDSDGDGYGDPKTSKDSAIQPKGYVSDNTDCDDSNQAAFPGSVEIVGDGIDQDCDGKDKRKWFLDSDNDGFGNAAKSQESASKPLGYVSDNTDCDDSDSTIYPGAEEIKGDGIDQDCNNKDALVLFDGVLQSDPKRGFAPVTIKFRSYLSQGTLPFIYDYDFGDGNTVVNGNKTEYHTYNKKGLYTAKVKITDASANIYEFSTEILVTDSDDLDVYQDNFSMNLELMKKAAQSSDMVHLLNNSKNIIQKSLEAVNNADANTKNKIENSVKTKIDDLVVNTETKLKSLISNNQVTDVGLKNISNGIKEMISTTVENSLPTTEKTFLNLESISNELYKASLDKLLANENLTATEIDQIKKDKNKAKNFFKSKKYLMDNVVDSSGIKIIPKSEFKSGDVDSIGSKHQLTDKQTAALYNSISNNIKVKRIITASTLPELNNKTIAQIAEELFNTYYGTGKTIVKSTVDPVSQNIVLGFSDGSQISFVVKSIAIVKDYMPKGIIDLPNGNKLGVTDYYAIEFAPYPVFPFDLSAEVIKLGINPILGLDGNLQVDGSQPKTTISLKTGWKYSSIINNLFQSLTTSFGVVGGADPSAEAYTYLVTYDTGLSQLLPPTVYAMDSLTQLLDSLYTSSYSIDTNTGVITVGTLKLKPDYTFHSLTNIDYKSITAAGGSQHNKLAFEFGDFNNNGLTDIKYYSDNPKGYQILYAVSK